MNFPFTISRKQPVTPAEMFQRFCRIAAVSGVQPAQLMDAARAAGQAKANEAAAKMAEYNGKTTQADTIRVQALEAAQVKLTQALTGADSKSRSAAEIKVVVNNLIKTADFFAKQRPGSKVAQNTNALLAFLGQADLVTVYGQIVDAAEAKNNEAVRLETEAAQAKAQAETANTQAIEAAKAAFTKALAEAAPTKDAAEALAQAAALMIEDVDFFTVK